MIKIDGFSLSDFGVSVDFESPETQTPEIRTNFAERGTYGSINYGTTHGNADFSFSCTIKGNIRANIKEIIKLFLDADGNYKEVKMEWSEWGNKYYMVMLTSPIVLTPTSEKTGEFDLEVTATTPFANSIYNTERYFGEVILTQAPLEIPIQYYGTYRTGFEVTFFGNLSYFDIEVWSADGSSRVFHYVSGSHDTYFLCNFTDFTISDNGANGLPNASGDFLYINRETTKVVFRGDMTGSVNFKYKEIYI